MMKKKTKIGLVIIFFSLVVYAGTFFVITRKTSEMIRSSDTDMAWLNSEFNLSDPQSKDIQSLTKKFQVHCSEMCQTIMENDKKLLRVIKKHEALSPEIKHALEENAKIKQDCQEKMLVYFYSVSQKMNPEESARYLDMMAPVVIHNRHPWQTPHHER